MAAPVGGQVGPVGKVTSGTTSQGFRQGNLADMIVSELNPRYYEQAYNGNVFFAGSQASITFAANGLTSASASGLCLYNPPASKVNLIPIQIEVMMLNYVTTSVFNLVGVASSAFSAVNPTTGTALTAYSAKGVGQATSSALVSQLLTFAANPIIWKQLFSGFVTTTISDAIPTINSTTIDVGGSIVILPGYGIALNGSNASTGLLSMTWMELPS